MQKEGSREDHSPTAIPGLPTAITSFAAARLGDSIYVYGGHHGESHHYSQEGQSGEFLELDLEEPSTWRVVSDGPRLQGLALVASEEQLYRVGGFSARNREGEEQDLWSVSDFAAFHPKKGDWEPLPSLPRPRSSFDAIIAADCLYVVGGWALRGKEEPVWHDTVDVVDLSQTPLTWKSVVAPASQRRALSVGTLGGSLYLIGGMQPDGEVTVGTSIFNPETSVWEEGPVLPGEGMEGFGSACFSAEDRLYVSTASGKVLELSSRHDSWKVVGELQMGRFFHRMLAVDRHHLVILGGANMKMGKFSESALVRVKS